VHKVNALKITTKNQHITVLGFAIWVLQAMFVVCLYAKTGIGAAQSASK